MLCSIHPNELDVVPCSICSQGMCKQCAEKLPIPICPHCAEEKTNKKKLRAAPPLNNDPPQGSPSSDSFNTNSLFISLKKVCRNKLFLRKLLVLFFFVILFSGLVWGSKTDRVELLNIADVRLFVLTNAENNNFEKLTVIEGKVINDFDEPRSFIELEAALYDADDNILEKKTQMAGSTLTFFQLQTLNELELEEKTRDNMSILNYDTNIQQGESVPFTFVFYNPPKTTAKFNIKIIDAQIPK